jgi:hypothetical protein
MYENILKCPLLIRDSEEHAVMRVISMVTIRTEPVSMSPVLLNCKIHSRRNNTRGNYF